MTHSYHPDLAERLQYKPGSGTGVLVDGCRRCEDQAKDPVGALDEDHMKALWREMVRVERHDGAYRSLADSRACQVLYQIAVFIERHGMDGDPWSYFREEVTA